MRKILKILFYLIVVTTNNPGVISELRPFLNSYVGEGKAPFIVFVETITKDKKFKCAGTILDKNYILTLASCVSSLDIANITVGANLISYDELNYEFEETQIRQISSIITNPYFKPDKLGQADLALLQVQKPFELNEFVNPIQVDGNGWPLDDGKPSERTCEVIGFGDIDYTKHDKRLKSRTVKATHSGDCPCARRNQWMNLVCLDPMGDVGLCEQDNGAPLICEEKLVGVNHMLVVRSNCSRALAPEDICGDFQVNSYFIYLCPYLKWVKETVVTVPSPTKYCNDSHFNLNYLHCYYLLLLILLLKCFV